MKKLTPTQKRSFTTAVIFMAALIVASLLGALPFFEDLFNEDTLANNHEITKPKHLVETEGYASVGLRHEVPVKLQKVTVARVVDGDTIVINGQDKDGNEDGSFVYVRLIGINAPESVSGNESQNTPEGYEASRHMKAILHPGDIVYLQCDTTLTDDYGRLLRYVWLIPPFDFTSPDEVRSKMLNARMLDSGYAVAHKYKPNDAYFNIFKAVQLEALHAKRGLWVNGVDWAQSI